MSPEEVRALARCRLLGEDTIPVGGGYLEEPSEDLVIQLLGSDDLQRETYAAVIAGCCDVYGELLRWLAVPVPRDASFGGEEIAIRLCRVVDVAAPEALRPQADAFLELALGTADLSAPVLPAAVRASMAYGCTASHVPMWERLLQRPEVAAYAFSALLQIDPHAKRIEEGLVTLWRKQLCEGWNVDTAFLMRQAARARQSESTIGRVLRRLDNELSKLPEPEQLRRTLHQQLQRREWSQTWGEELAPAGEHPQETKSVIVIEGERDCSITIEINGPMYYRDEDREAIKRVVQELMQGLPAKAMTEKLASPNQDDNRSASAP